MVYLVGALMFVVGLFAGFFILGLLAAASTKGPYDTAASDRAVREWERKRYNR
jgi:hypothetical protein